jgi:hypothetical protein
MGLLPTLLILKVAAPLAGVSTYDDAACVDEPAETASVTADGDEEIDCEAPPAPVVAVAAACEDPHATLWFGKMIGTCDMPRAPTPAQLRPSRLRAAFHTAGAVTSDEGVPVRLHGTFGTDEPGLASVHRFVPPGASAHQAFTGDTLAGQEIAFRLERPPRR